MSCKTVSPILPRLIRYRDAPLYLGMDRHRFNKEVRPFVVVIPIGIQGIAFDRLELDDWVEQYKSRNGRPGQLLGDQLWDEKEHRGFSKEPASGIPTNRFKGSEFVRALEQVALQKQNSFLQD